MMLRYFLAVLSLLGTQFSLSAQVPPQWKAKWIEPAFDNSAGGPCVIFRKVFTAGKKVTSAKLLITAHGMYQATFNGQPVTDALFTPGWTSYHKRLQYQVYDVKALLKANDTIHVVVGSGWWRGRLGLDQQTNVYGYTLGLFCQLEI